MSTKKKELAAKVEEVEEAFHRAVDYGTCMLAAIYHVQSRINEYAKDLDHEGMSHPSAALLAEISNDLKRAVDRNSDAAAQREEG
jgi:hypothetical protein